MIFNTRELPVGKGHGEKEFLQKNSDPRVPFFGEKEQEGESCHISFLGEKRTVQNTCKKKSEAF